MQIISCYVKLSKGNQVKNYKIITSLTRYIIYGECRPITIMKSVIINLILYLCINYCQNFF